MDKIVTKTRAEQKKDFLKMVEIRKKMPGDKTCKRCNDLGYWGWDVEIEYYIPCECLLKAEQKITQERLANKEVSEN